ncbi:hemolysin XhlA family protein [Clostridium polynesiense]|uniref:hemolysin XhlA family protein n=1 Tax=Clostridium polynesiense TaxID=1325933 RepID=UPI000590F13F|nr:hemolysin XhlA family protein [Clostridium polynesiense]
MAYNSEGCNERHKRLDEKIATHENRLNNHSSRIDQLEQNDKANAVRIGNLCEQIANLVTTMRWFIGLLVGSFVGFFFYAIQQNIFK